MSATNDTPEDSVPSASELAHELDADGLDRLWAAYELAQRRTTAFSADDPHRQLDAAKFHETLLQLLVCHKEGGEGVTPLRMTRDGVIVHVDLWEDEVLVGERRAQAAKRSP